MRHSTDANYISDSRPKSHLMHNLLLISLYPISSFFFFKQKTAYEIGLGIPAEPLFRSIINGFNRTLDAINNVFRKFSAFHDETGRLNVDGRSEERRVGKECRSRWSRQGGRKGD